MYDRLLIVITVIILGLTVYQLFRRLQLRRAQSAVTIQQTLNLQDGSRHVVYFWSEHCPQCTSAQKPALDRLLERVGKGSVELITLRVEDCGDLAKSWGVRTLPTTYVLDSEGNITHINNGLASDSRLMQQLELVST